jgi:hypothetical protein
VCLWCLWCVCGVNLNVDGCIAQSVERWSNKPLVKGSSPFVTTFVFVFFCCCYFVVNVVGRTCTSLQRRIRGRAVKALRSGRSPLCGRGFESHRMQLFFFSSFPERPAFVRLSMALVFRTGNCAHDPSKRKPSLEEHKNKGEQNKKDGGTGIRARVKRITTAYANHYTIPPANTPAWLFFLHRACPRWCGSPPDGLHRRAPPSLSLMVSFHALQ